jgi:uncharacterized peroxidase-related enzyme
MHSGERTPRNGLRLSTNTPETIRPKKETTEKAEKHSRPYYEPIADVEKQVNLQEKIMNRLNSIQPENATGQTAELFDSITRAIGKVPNAYKTIGIAPEILGQVLRHDATLAKSSLSRQEREAINLTVSEISGCDYCLAAHTLMSKIAGYSLEQIQALRFGHYNDNTRIDSLIKFVKTLITTHGTLDENTVKNIFDAGFNDRQVVEIISTISAILFTNMINRVNDTIVDFP